MGRYLDCASRTPVLAVTLVLALVLLVVVFPVLPIGGDALDATSGYSHQEALEAMESYGEQGRRVYGWSSATLDTLLPVAYVSFLSGLIYRLRPSERLWPLAYLPLAAGALDLGENIQIVVMLWQYPDVSAPQVAAASLFTVAKGVALLSCLALAAATAALWALHRARGGLRGPTR